MMNEQWNRITEKASKLKGQLPFPVPDREIKLHDAFEDYLDAQLFKKAETRHRLTLETIDHVSDELFSLMDIGDRHCLESRHYPHKRLIVRMDAGPDEGSISYTRQPDGSYKRDE